MLFRVHAAHFYLCRQLELPPRGAGADPAPLYCQGHPTTVIGNLQSWLCSALDLCRLENMGRNPPEIGHSWREWQGKKQHWEDPFIFVSIQVNINKLLRCVTTAHSLETTTASTLQGDRRLSVLDACSKITPFFFPWISCVSIHMNIYNCKITSLFPMLKLVITVHFFWLIKPYDNILA